MIDKVKKRSRKGTAPLLQSSQAIEETVVQALGKSSYPNLWHVRCDFREGLAILHGETPTHHLKQLAQEIVRKVRGVEQVVNQIVVCDRK